MWKINIYADKLGEQLRRILHRSIKLFLIDCIFRRGSGVRFLGVSYTLAEFCVCNHDTYARTDNEMHGTVCGRVGTKRANCLATKYRKFGDSPELRQLARDVIRWECRPYCTMQAPRLCYFLKLMSPCALSLLMYR